MSLLSESDLQFYKENGFLVIENIFTMEEICKYRYLFHKQLQSYGFNHNDININMDVGVRKKGITKNIFYSDWKMEISLNNTIYQTMKDLITSTYGNNHDHNPDPDIFSHNNGDFNDVLPYIDRVCYRLPDNIRAEYGLKLHIDRIPNADHGGKRWRPIQSFVTLTDHYTNESGGLQVVRGFHKRFNEYFRDFKDTKYNKDIGNENETMGEFYRMHHHNLNTETVIAPAGSLVIWDNRLPHSTCDKLTTYDTREVVYFSYIPNIPLNISYCKKQWENIVNNKQPPMYECDDPTYICDRNWDLEKYKDILYRTL